ncbi:MAG: Y-family DNA polymerase, partial [Sphingomicrobium sp.]
MKRIASIWLPNLAIECWAKSSDCAPDSPVVLTIEGTHGPVIHAVTKAAAERGARVGARLTDARALDPALISVAADIEGDAALMQRLAKWAARWSPLVEVDGPDGLRLDVTGVAHLFGGERGLVRDMKRCLGQLGLTARVAIAPTAAAAWALIRFPSPRRGEGGSAKLSGARGTAANRVSRGPPPKPKPPGGGGFVGARWPREVYPPRH